MAERLLPVDDLVALLTEAPGRIADATHGVTPELLLTRPAPEEWSANDVLAHLRSCGDVWGESMGRMLAEASPRIRAVSPRTWIGKTDYLTLVFEPSLRAYTHQRAALVAMLAPLTARQWGRTATVVGAGRPLVLTVHDYAHRMATHERAHVKQITRIVDMVVGTQS